MAELGQVVVAIAEPVLPGVGGVLHDIVMGPGQVIVTWPYDRATGRKASHNVMACPIHFLLGEEPWGLAPG